MDFILLLTIFIVGVFAFCISISHTRSECIDIIYGIKEPYKKIRNDLRKIPEKYGSELTEKEKIFKLIGIILVGVWFATIGLVWVIVPIIVIINH